MSPNAAATRSVNGATVSSSSYIGATTLSSSGSRFMGARVTGAVSSAADGRRGGGGARAVRGGSQAGGRPADHSQPAEGARRPGDGPRLLGRGAEGRAVPLRRRRARLSQPRRPGAAPDRVPGGRGRAATAGGCGAEDGQLQGR